MDYLTEEQRIEKLNASIRHSKQVWQHFVQNCHVDWTIVENKISSQLTDYLALPTKFSVKESTELEENACYMDGTSTDSDISVTFYCSPQIYSRAITIPVQVLANLEHDFTKVILHEYTSIISVFMNVDEELFANVNPVILESYSSELAYDYVATGDVTQSDVLDRFVQAKIPEVKSELFHRAALRAESFAKIK